LYLGIEPIFLPVGEPKRNSVVERLHGLWSQTFWRTDRFDTLAEVRQAAPQFVRFYMKCYHPVALQGATPSQAEEQVKRRQVTAEQVAMLPRELPLTAGRVHFVRLVTAQGQITLLNETWSVGKRLAGQYVWATINTQRRRLQAYHRQSERARAPGKSVSLRAARAGRAADGTIPATRSTAQDVHDGVSLSPSIELHSGFTMW